MKRQKKHVMIAVGVLSALLTGCGCDTLSQKEVEPSFSPSYESITAYVSESAPTPSAQTEINNINAEGNTLPAPEPSMETDEHMPFASSDTAYEDSQVEENQMKEQPSAQLDPPVNEQSVDNQDAESRSAQDNFAYEGEPYFFPEE